MLMQSKLLLQKSEEDSTLKCSRNLPILLQSPHNPPIKLVCPAILPHIQIHEAGTVCSQDLELKKKDLQLFPLLIRFHCALYVVITGSL